LVQFWLLNDALTLYSCSQIEIFDPNLKKKKKKKKTPFDLDSALGGESQPAPGMLTDSALGGESQPAPGMLTVTIRPWW